MDGTTRWTVVVEIRHVGGMTCAGARLFDRDSDILAGRGIVMGTADPTRTVEALATAHALADLATRLRRQAEDWAARPVRPSR